MAEQSYWKHASGKVKVPVVRGGAAFDLCETMTQAMKNIRFLQFLSSPFLVVMATCGGDLPPQAPLGTALTPQNYCEAFFEPFCERQIGCNFGLINQATSIESCITEASRLCQPELDTFLDSLEVERTLFSVEKLEACREETSTASCVQLAAGFVPDSCFEIFEGTAVQGEDCFTDVECRDGTICASAGRCPGLCEIPDGPPENVFNCALGGCPGGEFCLDGVCSSTLSIGDECPNDDEACEGILFCGRDVQDPVLRCRQTKPQGGSCFGRNHCQPGL